MILGSKLLSLTIRATAAAVPNVLTIIFVCAGVLDQIVADCIDLIAEHSLDPSNERDVVVKVLLGDQPLPLKGGTLPEQRAGVVAPS
jgi:hypothetical protein